MEGGCDFERRGERVMNKEFLIDDLFEIINNPQLDKVNFNFDEHAEYPYFTRTENNNGIRWLLE